MSDTDKANAGPAPTQEQAAKPAVPAEDAQALPTGAPHDAAHTWGDEPSDLGHDAWLRENKPPHWG